MSLNSDLKVPEMGVMPQKNLPNSFRQVPKGAPARFRCRTVRRNAPEGATFYKILLVSLLIFGLFCIPLVLAKSGDQRSLQASYPSTNHFTAKYTPYFLPGFRTAPNGRTACPITTAPASQGGFLTQTSEVESLFKTTFVENGPAFQSLREFNKSCSRKLDHCRAGLEPVQHENYKKALQYAEEKIVKAVKPFQKQEETLQDIEEIYRLFYGESKKPSYRDHWKVTDIVGETSIPKKDFLLNEAKKTGSPRDIEILQNSFKKIKDFKNYEKDLLLFNEEEWRVWQQFSFLRVHIVPEKIDKMMKYYATTLEKMSETPAIDLACFAHYRLLNISPNRKDIQPVARILLFAILKRGGEELVIKDSEAYRKAIFESDFQKFKSYVVNEIQWTKTHSKALDSEVMDS